MSAEHVHAPQGTHRSKLTIAVDPATWPDLVEAGRQAVADLVVTALPMVGNKVRANRRRDDQGSELSMALLQAAYRFRPQPDLKDGGWAAYVWSILDHTNRRGGDAAGVRRPHAETLAAQVWTGSFEGLDLERTWSARDRSVEDQALDSVSAATLREKLDALPAAERAVVVGRLEGKTHAAIGEELGVQASTTRKRLVNARERLEKLLDIPADAGSRTEATPSPPSHQHAAPTRPRPTDLER